MRSKKSPTKTSSTKKSLQERRSLDKRHPLDKRHSLGEKKTTQKRNRLVDSSSSSSSSDEETYKQKTQKKKKQDQTTTATTATTTTTIETTTTTDQSSTDGTERGRAVFASQPTRSAAMEEKALRREAMLMEAANVVNFEIRNVGDAGEVQLPNPVEWRCTMDSLGSRGRFPDAHLLCCSDMYGFPQQIITTALPSAVPGQMVPIAGTSLTTPLGIGSFAIPNVSDHQPQFEIKNKETKGDKFRSLFQLFMHQRTAPFPTRNRPEHSNVAREILQQLINMAEKATKRNRGVASDSIDVAFALAAKSDSEMKLRTSAQEEHRVALIACELAEACLTLFETKTRRHVRKDDVETIWNQFVLPAFHRLPVLLSVVEQMGRTIQLWSVGQLLTGCFLAEALVPFTKWPTRRPFQAVPDQRKEISKIAQQYVQYIHDKSMPKSPLEYLMLVMTTNRKHPWMSDEPL